MSEIPVGREFWRDLRQQIARRTRNPSDAEDLLHSAFLRFHQYRLENEVADPAAFIVKTACNLGIDNFRRRKQKADASEAEGIQDKMPLQDEVVASRERLRRVHVGIDRLPPKTREIFIMHRWHELKYQEIADRLEISVSSVEKHMARAMMFLSDWSEGW
jgi:RNA polymerase sigma factor (sigma-70 family)